MGTAAADLWHFLILFIILNGGFIALGMAQFAGEKEEFDTIGSSFETLWEMLLGSMIESGEIPSSTWSANPLIMMYLIFYNVWFIRVKGGLSTRLPTACSCALSMTTRNQLFLNATQNKSVVPTRIN